MDKKIINQVIELNRQFYQSFGGEFSATRGRIQPGVQKILERIGQDDSILDLGCGNGEFLRQLAGSGHRAPVLGVDFSLPLLNDAEQIPEGFSARFLVMDITAKQWSEISEPWSVITSFATLHHIPGEEIRLRILHNIYDRLAPGGQFIHSNWQFLNSERLRARIQQWEQVGLAQADVDSGDYLLDWRRGGKGYRYVHHFSEDELSRLAKLSGFHVVESFYSDGATGNLGLYQIWKKVKEEAHQA
ncbi:MAG: class I SAM-dependent methyltransferase [Anaerolineae bacterium]|nr:class I SAM-dependent methyltransferase [Anaerolineae bacterium]